MPVPGLLAIRSHPGKMEIRHPYGRRCRWLPCPEWEIALPVEAKPLFRPDALRPHLKQFHFLRTAEEYRTTRGTTDGDDGR
jgi:hypothetical protein